MGRTIHRNLLWAYALLLLLAAFGYARYDYYMMDGDGTAFLDIAQALRTGHAGLSINGYWNPAYPAVLALAEMVFRPDLWHELVVVRYADLAIFALAMLACVFFTSSLVRARSFYEDKTGEAVGDGAVHLLGLALLTLSLGRELPIAAPRSDTLLLVFLLLAGGLVLRLVGGAKFWIYPLLGLALGCAYLTKSFAFLPSVGLLLGLFVHAASRRRAGGPRLFAGALTATCLFAGTAGPYIAAISHQLGHLTTGDSARLNYAFFIDDTQRWHEWQHGTLGAASGPFTHPETLIASAPPIYSFAAHPFGTLPLWFDPAWWTAGLKPHVSLSGHGRRLLRNCVVFIRYLLNRPEILVLLAVVLAFGAALPLWSRPRSLRTSLWALAPIGWGLLMLGIYFPIDLQDRYLSAPFLLVFLPVFASLRVPEADRESSRPIALIATALIVLFAGIALAQAVTYVAERRREIPPAHKGHPGMDGQVFAAAAALDQLGLQPGDSIACLGDHPCYADHYWARLAGTQILAHVETPEGTSSEAVWDSLADTRSVTDPLRHMGLRYLVTTFPEGVHHAEGWVKLGSSDFFAYPLQAPVPESKAEAIAALPLRP